ncbi:alpha/beta hydrolase fold [Amycolatopsis xylanica]|uniref:Alpha/beta hydrolase fold n=1 Tax=Amycolatopsis xylanica TaxID=589385 RepID=A0A1H3RHP9_9PSEU|nr:alpha/beta hydrolase [Amycolatopsis xylanica]SDZ25342.1 alpha/beta hydrolase fold [Amycolatopsis xylanica]
MIKHLLAIPILAAALCPPVRPAIAWHSCEDTRLAAAGARCGEIRVPLDYQGDRTISVAVARRPATGHKRGALMVNNGGPGPSLDAVLLDGPLAAQYDLIAIDPRFFGRSTPLECGWTTGDYLRSAQFASPDRPAFEQSVAAAKSLAARCAPDRELLPHGSTRNIARDLDAVRAALGEPRISYLGWSYGGYLGAVYLQMFPGRADRVVLDSPVGPDAYGPALTRETGPADAAALADWATWAAVHNGQLGATAADVLSTVDEIAARTPFRLGEYRIDAAMLPGLLLTAVDSDAFYAELTAQVRVLRDAARGLAVTPTPDQAERLALYRSQDVVAEFGFSAGVANRCADRAAARDPETYWRDMEAHRAAEPFFGSLARQITPCAFWPAQPAEPPTRVDVTHSALVVGATGDPAAPYPGQQAMHGVIHGSRMVTLGGAFRHGVYRSEGTQCVGDLVERYLLDGMLPGGDVTCARPA